MPSRLGTDEATSGVPREAPAQQKFDNGRRVQRQTARPRAQRGPRACWAGPRGRGHQHPRVVGQLVRDQRRILQVRDADGHVDLLRLLQHDLADLSQREPAGGELMLPAPTIAGNVVRS